MRLPFYRKEYSALTRLGIPIMIAQIGFTLQGMADTIMVGQHQAEELSAVGFVNSIMVLAIMLSMGFCQGAVSLIGSLYTQGRKAEIMAVLKCGIVADALQVLLITAVMTVIYFWLPLMGLDPHLLPMMQRYYLILLPSLPMLGIASAFKPFTDSINDTRTSMWILLLSNVWNILFNWLLIYGQFGLPAMGAVGAAIATVISRFVELGILIIYTGKHAKEFPFISGAFKSFMVPKDLVKKFFLKAIPLMFNETLWSLGMTTVNQCYSYRSLDAVASTNIESTLWNLMGVAFLAMGEAVGIMMGHILGSGELEKAKKQAAGMRRFTVLCCIVFAVIMVGIAPFFPMLYNTTEYIRHLASNFILISAVMMPFCAYTHASYFIIRSGGNTLITVIFDSVYTWVLVVPLAYYLSRYTSFSVSWLIAIVRGLEVVKCLIAFFFVRSGIWIKNIVK